MNIFTAILLGVLVGISVYSWYMIIQILRYKEKKPLLNFNFRKVNIEEIDYEGDGIVWCKKIGFNGQQIYLGYEIIGEKQASELVSIPHACITVVKDKKRVGVALWSGKANWNLHEYTMHTINETANAIVEDLIFKVNPITDEGLREKFMRNGM